MLLVLACSLGLATSAAGQTAEKLKADAYDAARSVEQARQQAASAAEQLKVAEAEAERAAAAVSAAESAGPAASTAADRATAAATAAAIEEARKEAQLAHQKANQALAALKELQKRLAWDRSGAYIGASVFWAPAAFDTDLHVDASQGFAGWIGYRFTPRLAFELRAARLDDFDLSGSGFTGSLDGWEYSGNAKIYLLTKRFQPYLSIGGGSFVSRVEFEDVATGEKRSDRNRDFVARSGIGVDYYLTSNLVFVLEANYSAVGGRLNTVRFGELGGGLTYRF